MSEKLTGTVYDPNYSFIVPPKKSETRTYFFRVPVQWIWYISITTFLVVLVFYVILWIFWIVLYQQHFLEVTIITWINVLWSLYILFRNPKNWKSLLDMLRILYKYMKKPNMWYQRHKRNYFYKKFWFSEMEVNSYSESNYNNLNLDKAKDKMIEQLVDWKE